MNYNKKYYQKNKKRIKRINKAYAREKYALDKKFREKRHKAYAAYYRKNKNKVNKRQRKYYHRKYGKDVQFTLKKTVTARIRMALKAQGATRAYSYNVLIGCSYPTYQRYLRKKFHPGMRWKDHKLIGWQIDHIRPVSSFDLNKCKNQLKAFNYKNTQPLPAKENYKKAAKYVMNLEKQNRKLKEVLKCKM